MGIRQDFPSKAWLSRFSDVIGASHTVDYRFWQYNGMASNGLKQVAEHGSTRVLESELKNQVCVNYFDYNNYSRLRNKI